MPSLTPLKTAVQGSYSGSILAETGVVVNFRFKGNIMSKAFPRTFLLNRVAVGAVFLAGFVNLASGQSTFGSITGTVTDPSGAAIPNAKTIARNEATAVERSVQSAADGVYSLTDLLPGTYTVSIEATGFSTLERKGVVLDANRIVNVDGRMAVGSASSKVEVTGAAPIINTETSTTSFVKTGSEIVDTPLAMRQAHSNLGFATYNPGANVGGSAEIMANGIRTLDGYSSTDGIVEMSDPVGVGGGQISPDMDSIAEVNYILVDAPAEFKSPVNFTTVTKSGTNAFHGMAFYEYLSSELNARNFFSATVPFRVYNDFVLNLGGPIRKNKAFFFFNYDQEHNRNETVVTGNTPPVAWRNGDFSSLLPTAIKNPLTGVAFPGNIVPTSLINPQGANTMSILYPLPNYGPPTLQAGNWRGNIPGLSNPKSTDWRVDYNFSEKDVVYVRFTYRHIAGLAAQAFMPPEGQYHSQRDSTTGAAVWTHTFGAGLLNELRFGGARNNNVFHPLLEGGKIVSQIGIPGVPTTVTYGVPGFIVTGLTSQNQTTNGKSVDTDFQYTDTLSWTRGAHSMKFGFDAIQDFIPTVTYTTIYGAYTFNGSYSGNASADLLLGLPQSIALTVPVAEPHLHGTMWSLYAQDQWKVTPRLTANYGLRYELPGPYYESNGHLYTFNPANGDLVIPPNGISGVNPLYPNNIPLETTTQAGYPNTIVTFQKVNFYPRVGLAYKITEDGKTAIRAGYGIYGDTIYGSMAQTFTGGPFGGSETITNSTAAATVAAGKTAFTLSNPFTSGAKGTSAALQSVLGINPDIKVPYLQQWNVTLERQIGTMGLSIAYVGAHATDLLYGRNLNEPAPSTTPFTGYTNYPKLGTITYVTNGATQNYHSLQLAAVKHLGKGLTFTTGFTWARDLTDSPDNGNYYNSQQLIQNQYNLKAEYGNNVFTPNKRFIAEAVYSLPFGKGQRLLINLPRVANAVIGGWRLSSVVVAQTGLYFTPSFSGFDAANTNNLSGRPDVVSGVSVIPSGGQSISNWFNLGAFAVPGCPSATPCSKPANVGRFGDAGVNILSGPGVKNLDLALMKDFHTTERFAWQIMVQGVNAFNHPNFGNPTGNISTPATGSVITATATAQQGSSPARTVYAMIKVNF